MAKPPSEKKVLQKRQEELQDWFHGILPTLNESNTSVSLLPLSGDASFRRYFTARPGETTYVLVDAPPDKENSRTFVQIAEKFLDAGINVPVVFDVNYQKGFMCLSYLGKEMLWEKLDALKRRNHLVVANDVYQEAMEILLKIQGIREGSDILLPPFDGITLLSEMDLFREWFCAGIMGLDLSEKDNILLEGYFEKLIDTAMDQPQVCVHRDYHSRNLVYQPDGNFGVLDFQDAVVGPITYDLVSLLKDCYISWPRAMIREWALHYANRAQTAGVMKQMSGEEFLFKFDMMGLQRHLKAVGIFSRLHLRDGKSGYLGDIPRTLAYIKEVLSEYPEMYEFGRWLERNVYLSVVTRLHQSRNRMSDK